jgi:hypothetical protein
MQRSDDARNSPRTPRRRFLQLLTAAVAGLRIPGRATVAGLTAAVAAAPQATVSYLRPQYLPPGFKPVGEQVNRLDGFGKDARELALWFRNGGNPMSWNAPLVIFERPGATGALFATQGRPGELVTLRLSDGKVPATYHDGMWQPAPTTAGLRELLTR